MARPLIAIPGRFSDSASALRHRAVVNARALLEAVYRAGGEPLTVLPPGQSAVTPEYVAERVAWADGILLPGGGDLDPSVYGAPAQCEHLYDVDPDQDAFDVAVAKWSTEAQVPLLAVCRGLHVVVAARGGVLEQHMEEPHRYKTHDVSVNHASLGELVGSEPFQVSCYHHQRIEKLAPGLTVAAQADDGTIEAVVDHAPSAWMLGVQWHPEDLAETDRRHQAIFDAFVEAAKRA